ncbi:hypothetical protein EMIHUDRAFT_109116 [Emiliania huxleyi CCMP1516]|uniref:Protein HGH1 homolog n=2 Tax=Emiliania huxleyi TaxID=2903 RepID=A0A0D3KT07_EMIH1|nr:hypothetical protein EMIHUDRAFT_109116 [Emiliania huxleyi CCMP1516]EOD38892.1 hypothetical protein EMIHUDRAFT_109116 [Emiliania huxleyi CCMP1516]|eukprot:XP_005791321.1 hypothetical protein EMIHUDRAFT_109116 [Emiliania huxleyi CCMP1516]
MSLALDAAELAKLPPPEVDSVESSPVESCDEEYERSAVAALIVLSSLAEQHATAQGVVPCRRTPSTEWESAGSQSDSPRVVRRKLGDGAAASALCSRGDAQTLKHSNRIQPSPALAAEAVAAYSSTDDGVAALVAAADALLPGLVSLLGRAEAEAAGHAAAALVNICSSADGSAAAVGAGVFEAAVAQLDSGSAEVRERCTMLLANLTNPSLVDATHLLRGGSLDSLLAAIFTASATERPSEGRVSEAAAHHCCPRRARATRIKRIPLGSLVAQAPATLEHLVSALCHVASTDSGRGELLMNEYLMT